MVVPACCYNDIDTPVNRYTLKDRIKVVYCQFMRIRYVLFVGILRTVIGNRYIKA